jgi:hypothetical protein
MFLSWSPCTCCFFTHSFQHFSSIFGFQKFDYDVPLMVFSHLSCLEFAEFLRSIYKLEVFIKFRKLNLTIISSNTFSFPLSLFSFGTPFIHMFGHCIVSYWSLRLSLVFFFWNLCSIISVDYPSNSLTFSSEVSVFTELIQWIFQL